MKSLAACGWILALTALPVMADDAATRTFELAEELMRGGRVDQALEAFGQVADGFPDSDLADDALLVLARRTFDPSTPGSLSRADIRGAAAATAYLERILRSYPSSDGAGEAGYLMGLAQMVPGSPQYDLDGAFAAFRGVIAVHPESPRVPAARLGCALTELGMGRDDAALLQLEGLLLEGPSGPLADRARLQAADAWVRLGNPWQALDLLSQVRVGGQDAAVRDEALDLLTRLRRFDLPEIGRPVDYSPDPAYPISAIDLGGDVIAARLDGDGNLHVLSAGGRTWLRIGPDGIVLDRTPVDGARSLFREPGGRVGWAGQDRAQASDGMVRFRRSDEKLAPLTVVAAAPDGSWVAIDERGRELLRFLPDGAYRDSLPFAGRAIDLEIDARGVIWVLDAKRREVRAYAPDGSAGPTLSSPAIGDPGEIAVDGAYHVHILDRSSPSIFVFAPDGSLFGEWRFDRQREGALRDPRAFDVDRSGALIVVDGKSRRARRFQ